MNIAFLGAGRMGRPIVERLIAAGHECTLWLRREEARETARAAGLVCSDSLSDAVQHADVVLCVVQNDEQVRAVCLGPGAALSVMKPGATLVQHTTCDPATLELIAREATARNVRVLDAALSGGPHDIAAATLTLWVGGDESLLSELRPVLQAYASPILFVGTIGHGQRVKLVNNALFVAQVGLAIDAVRIASGLGLSEPDILAALRHGSAASRALEVVARAGSVAAVGERLSALMSKDVRIVREVAERSGADLGIVGTVLSSDAVEKQVLRSR
jgi:3-hydroxyisobutyrate dehydrogenase-like beta-hydroxyacid dehydrogenase